MVHVVIGLFLIAVILSMCRNPCGRRLVPLQFGTCCCSISWYRVCHRDLGHVTFVVWWGGRLHHIILGRVMAAFV